MTDVQGDHTNDGSKKFIIMTICSVKHLRIAKKTIQMIIFIMGVLSLIAISGGIFAIVWNAYSPTEMSFFGAKISTGHVGIAFTALGLICMVAVIRSVLKTMYRLAELPDNKKRDKTR